MLQSHHGNSVKTKHVEDVWALVCSIRNETPVTVDREIFALKIIRVKIFRVDKFSRFRSIREIFLTVDDCNMDEHLESLWLLVYYLVSGEPGIARCSHQSDIYLEEFIH